MSISIEYAYDKNGNLTRDDNKGMTFTYDLLGHPLTIAGSDNQTDYVYSADGRKLRATHTQGDNRTLIGSNGQRDQYSHFYPYVGLMGDISTNDAHSYKYGGKELDRDFGIDLFDFEARQYDAKVPGFTSIDPLAEKYYGISPYAYCAGDPVNCVDPTGEAYYDVSEDGVITMRQDEHINDKTDFLFAAGNDTPIEIKDPSILSQLSTNSHNNSDGTSTIWANSSSNSEMIGLMFFLHDNTNIEWSMSKYSDGSSTIGAFKGYAPKGDEAGASPSSFARFDGHDPKQETKHIHSHIDNYLPSGSYTIYNKTFGTWEYDMKKAPARTKSDQLVYENKFKYVFDEDYNKMSLHYVLYKNKITQYTFWTANKHVDNRKSFVW